MVLEEPFSTMATLQVFLSSKSIQDHVYITRRFTTNYKESEVSVLKGTGGKNLVEFEFFLAPEGDMKFDVVSVRCLQDCTPQSPTSPEAFCTYRFGPLKPLEFAARYSNGQIYCSWRGDLGERYVMGVYLKAILEFFQFQLCGQVSCIQPNITKRVYRNNTNDKHVWSYSVNLPEGSYYATIAAVARSEISDRATKLLIVGTEQSSSSTKVMTSTTRTTPSTGVTVRGLKSLAVSTEGLIRVPGARGATSKENKGWVAPVAVFAVLFVVAVAAGAAFCVNTNLRNGAADQMSASPLPPQDGKDKDEKANKTAVVLSSSAQRLQQPTTSKPKALNSKKKLRLPQQKSKSERSQNGAKLAKAQDEEKSLKPQDEEKSLKPQDEEKSLKLQDKKKSLKSRPSQISKEHA